jgi:hypothetical protein
MLGQHSGGPFTDAARSAGDEHNFIPDRGHERSFRC